MQCSNKNCLNYDPSTNSKIIINIGQLHDENFSLGNALESIYPLLDIILNYLGSEDLKQAAKVSTSWKETAENILKKRNQISWLTIYKINKEMNIHTDKFFGFNNIQFGIVLHTYVKSLNTFMCLHEHNKSKQMCWSKFLKKYVISSNIEYCTILCPKLDSKFPKYKIPLTLKQSMFDAILIPHIPNIRLAYLLYPNPNVSQQSFNLSSNEKIRCLLIFSSSGRRSNNKIIGNVLENHNWLDVALGGGIITKTVLHTNEYNSIEKDLCLGFIEDMNHNAYFNASSIVIPGTITRDEFQTILLKFKNSITIREKRFAIKFCCIAKKNIEYESEIFNDIFPDTTLIGIHAFGEIGWNCFNGNNINSDSDNSYQCEKKIKYELPKSNFKFSSVIVFLTWGRIISN